jgi:hypothetical protein
MPPKKKKKAGKNAANDNAPKTDEQSVEVEQTEQTEDDETVTEQNGDTNTETQQIEDAPVEETKAVENVTENETVEHEQTVDESQVVETHADNVPVEAQTENELSSTDESTTATSHSEPVEEPINETVHVEATSQPHNLHEITESLDQLFTTQQEVISKRIDTTLSTYLSKTQHADQNVRRVIDKLAHKVAPPTTVDPSVQVMFQNFITKMDEIVLERDAALSNRMSRVAGSLSKLTQSVKHIQTQKPTQVTQTDTLDDSDLRTQLEEEKKKVAQKVADLETLNKKVADWKDKVKQITTRDLQTIQQLKKQLKEKEDQVQQFTLATPQSESPQPSEAIFTPGVTPTAQPFEDQTEKVQSLEGLVEQLQMEVKRLNEEKDALRQQAVPQETIESKEENAEPQPSKKPLENFTIEYVIDVGQGRNQVLLSHQDGSVQWIDQQELETSCSESLEYPETLSRDSLENVKKELAAKDEELRTYKIRASAALKKKTESVTKIQVDHETKIGKLQNEYEQLEKKYRELQSHETELESQLKQLIDVQSESIRMADEIDQLAREKEDLEAKLRDCTTKLNNLESKYENDKLDWTKQTQELVQKNQEKISDMESSNRKELQVHRERTRRMMEEKERDIAKLQLKMTNMVREQKLEMENMKEQMEKEIREQMVMQAPPVVESPAPEQIPLPPSPLEEEEVSPRQMRNETEILQTALSPIQMVDVPLDQVPVEQPAEEEEETGEPDIDKFMQFAQLQASRDGELLQYKRSVNELQNLLLNTEQSLREQKDIEARLKREIEHYQTLYQHGAPNLEYLKNVLLKYLETKDTIVRAKLFKVVATILDFTQEEQERVRRTWEGSSSSGGSGGLFGIFKT